MTWLTRPTSRRCRSNPSRHCGACGSGSSTALATGEHPTHAHLALTLEWIARVEPKRAVLTHMSHQFDYETLRGALPAGVVPGHDGLIVDTNELDTL